MLIKNWKHLASDAESRPTTNANRRERNTTMKWSRRIAKFLASEDGPTTVEYAVMLALIVGMMWASMLYVSSEVHDLSEKVADGLDKALND